MNRPALEQGLPSLTNMGMPAGLPFGGAMPPTAMGKPMRMDGFVPPTDNPMAAFNRMAGPMGAAGTMVPPGLTTGLSSLPPMSLPGMGLGKGGMGRPTMPMQPTPMGAAKGGMGMPMRQPGAGMMR